MPELPDITVYVEALSRRLVGRTVDRFRVASPAVLRGAFLQAMPDLFGRGLEAGERWEVVIAEERRLAVADASCLVPVHAEVWEVVVEYEEAFIRQYGDLLAVERLIYDCRRELIYDY